MKALGDGIIDVGDLGRDPMDVELEQLRAENRKLLRAVSDANIAATRAREDADRSMATLRRALEPLYRGLQMVFGEFDAAGVSAGIDYGVQDAPKPPAGGNDPRVTKVWEEWKQKLGASSAVGRTIDALLVHGALTVVQLKAAGQMGTSTASESITKLNKLGLLDKNGSKWSLRKL